MGGFVDYLLRTEHILIACSVWVAIGLVRRLVPELERNHVWVRLLPLMPTILCSISVWLPDLVEGGPTDRILLGLVLGSFCGHLHKLFKQTVFGVDNRIRDHPARL